MNLNTVLSILALTATTASAQTISPEAAIEHGRQFLGVMQRSPHRSARRGPSVDPQLQTMQLLPSSEVVPTDSLWVDDQGVRHEAFYVVQPLDDADGGYVFVAADERQYTILGYNYGGHFDPERLNPTQRGWLTHYATEMRDMNSVKATLNSASTDGTQTASAHPAWNMLNSLPIRTEGVKGMVKIEWSQNAPYNNMCPNPSNKTSPCVTGCVATAYAQMMKYYNYPAVGKGSHSYTTETLKLELSATYEGVQYDWDNILPSYRSSTSYTQAQADAVAQLMYHTGVAVDMDYDYGGSGTDMAGGPNAMVNYFSYDRDMIVRYTKTGTPAEWHRQLLHELNEGRPIVYGTAGHCFLLDGYEVHDDCDIPYYHMNMGWGYSFDYGDCYLISGAPLLGSSDTHQMGIGMVPENDVVKPYYKFSTVIDLPSLVKHGVTPPAQPTIVLSAETSRSFPSEGDPIEANVQLVAYDQTGKQTTLGSWPIAELKYFVTFYPTIDFASLPLGRYVLEWRVSPTADSEHYTIVYGEQQAVVVYSQTPELTATFVDKPVLIEGQDHQITFSVTNAGSETYFGALTEALTNQEGVSCQFLTPYMTLEPGQSTEVSFSGMIDDLPSGPVTFTLHESYQNALLYDHQGGDLSFEVETQPVVPLFQLWNISLWTSYGTPYAYVNGYNSKKYPFCGQLGLVVVDDYDNVIDVLWQFAKTYDTGSNYRVSYSSYLINASMERLCYCGKLPDGQYRVKAGVRQKNSDQWTLYTCKYEHPGLCVPLTLSGTTGSIGNETSGILELTRKAYTAEPLYHNITIRLGDVTQVLYNGNRLYQQLNHRVCMHDGSFALRILPLPAHRARVLLDGNDVTSQVQHQILRLSHVTADHELQVIYTELQGDANADDAVTVGDLAYVVGAIDNQEVEGLCSVGADVNHNGLADEADVEALAQLILTGGTLEPTQHEAVDLGLQGFPDLRWATCNLGAEHPQEVGDYYSWGEVAPKAEFYESQYTYYTEGNPELVTRYNADDQLTHLQSADDAAAVRWGDGWRLPTVAETRALAQQCTIRYYNAANSPYYGVSGYLVTGPNGNTIFLPINNMEGGYSWASQFMWTSDLKSTDRAYISKITNSVMTGDSDALRSMGIVIRPVRVAR